MARIQNPQDQYGNSLVTQREFDSFIENLKIPEELDINLIMQELNRTILIEVKKQVDASIKNLNINTGGNSNNENNNTENITFNNTLLSIGGVDISTGENKLAVDTNNDGQIDINECIAKTNAINFRGSLVKIIPNSNGSVDLWFGETQDPPFFNTISDFNNNEKYIFSNSFGLYDIPKNITPGKLYNKVSKKTDTPIIKLNNGNELSLSKNSVISVQILKRK